MPNQPRDISAKDTTSFPYIVEKNLTVPLRHREGIIRADVFRPRASDAGTRCPVLVTFGPYGKDVWYELFRKSSFDEVPADQKSAHSAWETPDPHWWTVHAGYIVVRADEAGIGQSPGLLDPLSGTVARDFKDTIEWAAEQPWSNGKVGLMGVSYYAITQWMVAALRPKGLACIVPWEGTSDLYREWGRHGGIMWNTFADWWWNAQVFPNQYGRPRKEKLGWPETIEGNLSEEELSANALNLSDGAKKHPYTDAEFWQSRVIDLSAIDVPLLSVANWGGLNLHLRGNVMGYMHAKSKLKYLRFIAGRHDLPFYYSESVAVQKSFLDAFLQDNDTAGWSTPGKVPAVSLLLREGDVGVNDPAAEAAFQRRDEPEWPLRNTQYQKFHLTPDLRLRKDFSVAGHGQVEWRALTSTSEGVVKFTTPPFEERTEFTGHPAAKLFVSVAADSQGRTPSDMDLFLRIRHIGPNGKEIFYSGPTGEPSHVTGGWLRVSHRKPGSPSVQHSHRSADVLPVDVNEVYEVDVEIWPTNVVVSPGGRLQLELSGADPSGVPFAHSDPDDRRETVFAGLNRLHFAAERENYVILPFIPPRGTTGS